MRTLLLTVLTGGLYLLVLAFRSRGVSRTPIDVRRHLVLVRLIPEQIEKAKAANGPRKQITHALVCGPYGSIFGTERQCLKYFDAWNPAGGAVFPDLFDRGVKVNAHEIRDFETTFNLVNRLTEAQDRMG